MSAILGFFLSNPTILAIGAGIIAVAGAWFKGSLSGAKAERNKQAAAEAKARDIADQVDNDIGALPADAARKELGQWSKS
ncbi:ABC transporter permease [Mesorhizobium wenxiniae]|uniref:ABC transporter permease n=1 Tax=Mesorhizobium wenxiniae TaxID=2014805 RepID=A0A271KDX3_9HYPH|nr:ABC transporter permease [Mesorhizobium wenxiniae]PAP93978.1 ABC transporter permease [Mesorhizobium wenxiniae]